MKVDELLRYLKIHGEELKSFIIEGSYKPNYVRRVAMLKGKEKTRPLGIPTVVDRVIQQLISSVRIPIFEKKVSKNSYGFRQNRNTYKAIERCKGRMG